MTNIINSIVTTDQNITQNSQTLNITTLGGVFVSSGTAVTLSGVGDTLIDSGQITSPWDGIDALATANITIAKNALDAGWTAVFLGGALSQLANYGQIHGWADGVLAGGPGSDQVTNEATGVITAGADAIVQFKEASALSIVNQGTVYGLLSAVQSGAEAVSAIDKDTAGFTLNNSGAMSSGTAAGANSNEATIWADNSVKVTDAIVNSGSIFGIGYAIESLDDALNITNSGQVLGGLWTAASAVAKVTNSGSWFTDLAADGLVFQAAGSMLTNPGSIHGNVAMTGANAILSNSGSILGAVTVGNGAAITNGGDISGNVVLGTNDTLTNTGIIYENVTFGADDFMTTHADGVCGSINFATGDTLELATSFGNETLDNFFTQTTTKNSKGVSTVSTAGHDTLEFSSKDFSSASQVLKDTVQQGANAVIWLDAKDTVTLVNFQMSQLTTADIKIY